MKIPLVDLKAQYATIQPEIDDAIKTVLNKTNFIQGEEVRLFESEFAAFCKSKYGVGASSGTDALDLALLYLGVGPGDEVITPTHTFTATAEAIVHCGATPVLVDSAPRTFNIDPAKIEEKITKNTKVILPVHLTGQPADMDPIMEVANRHGIPVLEDACQAHGAEYRGTRVGNFGVAACYSFYPGKNLGAYGDAGAIVTNDKKLADWCAMMADHGRTEKYSHSYVGYGKRMDTLQAAILRAKLPHLEDWTNARRRAAAAYDTALSGVVEIPYQPEYARSVYHLYMITIKNREEVRKRMVEAGVGVGIHYPIPIHMQPAYANLGHKHGDFPVAEKAADSILTLPVYPEITDEQIDYVVAQLKAAIA